jgi:hypothetical protein
MSESITLEEYTRGDVHEHQTESLCTLLKPYLGVFRGISKPHMSGYMSFFQFLRS